MDNFQLIQNAKSVDVRGVDKQNTLYDILPRFHTQMVTSVCTYLGYVDRVRILGPVDRLGVKIFLLFMSILSILLKISLHNILDTVFGRLKINTLFMRLCVQVS